MLDGVTLIKRPVIGVVPLRFPRIALGYDSETTRCHPTTFGEKLQGHWHVLLRDHCCVSRTFSPVAA